METIILEFALLLKC